MLICRGDLEYPDIERRLYEFVIKDKRATPEETSVEKIIELNDLTDKSGIQ